MNLATLLVVMYMLRGRRRQGEGREFEFDEGLLPILLLGGLGQTCGCGCPGQTTAPPSMQAPPPGTTTLTPVTPAPVTTCSPCGSPCASPNPLFLMLLLMNRDFGFSREERGD